MVDYTIRDLDSPFANQEVMVREDLDNFLSTLFPAETPLTAAIPAEPMSQIQKDYGVDTLQITRTASTAGNNARPESWTAVDKTDSYPTRLKVLTEINARSFKVSETDRAAIHAGITDPYSYRAWQTMVEVVNDFELSFTHGVGTQAAVAIRKTQGLLHWTADTGLERNAGSAGPITDIYGTSLPKTYWANMYDAAGSNLDRTIFEENIIGAAVDNGFIAEGSLHFTGRRLKRLISEFNLTPQGAINERNINAYDRMFVDVVNAIETDQGTVYIAWNRYLDLADGVTVNNTGRSGTINQTVLANETILGFMPGYVSRGVFRGVGFAPLAKDGDNLRGMIVGEQAIVVKNPLALTGGTNLLA